MRLIWKRAEKSIASFFSDRQGSSLPLVAVAITALCGVTALAVDWSVAFVNRNQLQMTGDQAALAAAMELPDIRAARKVAMQVAKANMRKKAYGKVLRKEDIEFGTWDAEKKVFTIDNIEPNAIRIATRRTADNGNEVSTLFGRALGFKSIDVTTQSIASLDTSTLELALVLDVSGSMRQQRRTGPAPNDDDGTVYTPPLGAGRGDPFLYGNGGGNSKGRGRRLKKKAVEAKVYSLQRVVLDLMADMFDDSASADSLHVAVLPFSGRVNIFDFGIGWMEKQIKPKDRAKYVRLCTGERKNIDTDMDDTPPALGLFKNFKGNSISCPEPPALGLTSDQRTVEDAVLGLVASGTTNTDIGMAFGWRALSPRWRGEWGEPDFPRDYDTDGLMKAVIIITDGENTPRQTGDKYSTYEADQRLAEACEQMKDDGITIFAVNFDAPPRINALYQDCVSEPNYWFDARNSAALEVAFGRIRKELKGKPRLVR